MGSESRGAPREAYPSALPHRVEHSAAPGCHDTDLRNERLAKSFLQAINGFTSQPHEINSVFVTMAAGDSGTMGMQPFPFFPIWQR